MEVAEIATDGCGTAEGGVSAPKEISSDDCVVDFVVLPEGSGQTKKVFLDSYVKDIREELAIDLGVSGHPLVMVNMSGAVMIPEPLRDDDSFRHLGLKPGDRCAIELRVDYSRQRVVQDCVLSSVVEVQVVSTQGVRSLIRVHVEREDLAKEFAGGFRNKKTGTVFHHAVTQTTVEPSKVRPVRYHREVQTYEQRTRSAQCGQDAGTQMPRPGLVIDNSADRIIIPGPYFSSVDLASLRLEKCIELQRHARGMLARRRAQFLRSSEEERKRLSAKRALALQREADRLQKWEVERRANPTTCEDFDLLHKEMEDWHSKEAKSLHDAHVDQKSLVCARRELLDKETKLLQDVDKLKVRAHQRSKEDKIQNRLEAMAKPKVWEQESGATTTVHTPFTTRAQELMEVYTALRLPLRTAEERLDVLQNLKWTVKDFDSNLAREISQLVDREADMMDRRRPEASFSGLRRRLANLFLQLIETPEFNPEAGRFQKVPRQLTENTGVRHSGSAVSKTVVRA